MGQAQVKVEGEYPSTLDEDIQKTTEIPKIERIRAEQSPEIHFPVKQLDLNFEKFLENMFTEKNKSKVVPTEKYKPHYFITKEDNAKDMFQTRLPEASQEIPHEILARESYLNNPKSDFIFQDMNQNPYEMIKPPSKFNVPPEEPPRTVRKSIYSSPLFEDYSFCSDSETPQPIIYNNPSTKMDKSGRPRLPPKPVSRQEVRKHLEFNFNPFNSRLSEIEYSPKNEFTREDKTDYFFESENNKHLETVARESSKISHELDLDVLPLDPNRSEIYPSYLILDEIAQKEEFPRSDKEVSCPILKDDILSSESNKLQKTFSRPSNHRKDLHQNARLPASQNTLKLSTGSSKINPKEDLNVKLLDSKRHTCPNPFILDEESPKEECKKDVKKEYIYTLEDDDNLSSENYKSQNIFSRSLHPKKELNQSVRPRITQNTSEKVSTESSRSNHLRQKYFGFSEKEKFSKKLLSEEDECSIGSTPVLKLNSTSAPKEKIRNQKSQFSCSEKTVQQRKKLTASRKFGGVNNPDSSDTLKLSYSRDRENKVIEPIRKESSDYREKNKLYTIPGSKTRATVSSNEVTRTVFKSDDCNVSKLSDSTLVQPKLVESFSSKKGKQPSVKHSNKLNTFQTTSFKHEQSVKSEKTYLDCFSQREEVKEQAEQNEQRSVFKGIETNKSTGPSSGGRKELPDTDRFRVSKAESKALSLANANEKHRERTGNPEINCGELSDNTASKEHHSKEVVPDENDPIEDVLSDLEGIKRQVENFTGATSDKQYVYLDQKLNFCVVKLDDVDTNGREDIRQRRKSATKEVRKTLSLLKDRANK